MFVLRIRGPTGMKRANFLDDTETWLSLQLQIKKLFNIDIDDQLIYDTQKMDNLLINNRKSSLKLLNYKNGKILYCKSNNNNKMDIEKKKTKEDVAKYFEKNTRRMTSKCNHSPHASCSHCAFKALDVKSKRKCNHGSNSTCLNCSKKIKNAEEKKKNKDGKNEQVAGWLCNHGKNTFCPKCIPKETPGRKKRTKSMMCQCRGGQKCLHCAKVEPTIKVNFMPYKQYMKKIRGGCKLKHNDNTSCPSCAPPKMPTYAGKKNCTGSHKPFPAGVCLKCAPPNANIKMQAYRHCDLISFHNVRALQGFYQDWARSGINTQRAGILIGKYSEESPETKNEGAIRANVHAVYMPPQEFKNDKIRFLKDVREPTVKKICNHLGLEVVGWVITSNLQRQNKGEKYGGSVFLTGWELRQAARFQNIYSDNEIHSKFVTLVIEHADVIEPIAYQVSDQCVALERDGVLDDAKDPFVICARKPKKKEILPKVIYKTKQLNAGEEFLCDELIVKVIVSAPAKPLPMFKHSEFSSQGNEFLLKQYLSRRRNEPLHNALSDFNLLCYLPQIIGLSTTELVCKAIVDNKPLTQQDTKMLRASLSQYL